MLLKYIQRFYVATSLIGGAGFGLADWWQVINEHEGMPPIFEALFLPVFVMVYAGAGFTWPVYMPAVIFREMISSEKNK